MTKKNVEATNVIEYFLRREIENYYFRGLQNGNF